jgi:hypothetical protein
LQNRVRLQEDGLDLPVLVTDYQTITDPDSPASLPEDVRQGGDSYVDVRNAGDQTVRIASLTMDA